MSVFFDFDGFGSGMFLSPIGSSSSASVLLIMSSLLASPDRYLANVGTD